MFLVVTFVLTLCTALLIGAAYRRRGAWCWWLPLGLLFAAMFSPSVFPPLGEILYFQCSVALLLLIWFAFAAGYRRSQKCFLCVAIVLAWVPLSVHGLNEYDRWRQFRESTPSIDLADRAREPDPAEAFDGDRLEMLEGRLQSGYGMLRERKLRRFHDSTYLEFINAPNFGFRRMISDMIEERNYSQFNPPSQPGPLVAIPWPDGEGLSNGEFLESHFKSIAEFASSNMNGWTKEPRVAVGFSRHVLLDLQTRPKDDSDWRIRRLDLLGLVVHPEPVVYVSEKLPAMQEIGKVPTRKPDPFEAFALEKLRKGEDLVYYEVSEGMRMLGAIRNASKCVDCHGGNRGDLLGAFSYSLTKD